MGTEEAANTTPVTGRPTFVVKSPTKCDIGETAEAENKETMPTSSFSVENFCAETLGSGRLVKEPVGKPNLKRASSSLVHKNEKIATSPYVAETSDDQHTDRPCVSSQNTQVNDNSVTTYKLITTASGSKKRRRRSG